MLETILNSAMLWVSLTVGLYLLAGRLKEKWPKNPLFTPLVFAIIAVILILLVTGISQETYNIGGQFFSLFVTPATVALAIKLEKNFVYLKKYYTAILTGIFSGVLFHTVMIYVFGFLFNFDLKMIATLIPKSITTAIAVGVSGSLGGIVSLTVAVVVFTGVIGAVVAPAVFKLAKITDPVAQGVALGSSSHAMGTTKAIEMGEVQGAMSGMSIVVTGIVVVILAPLTVPITNMLF